MKVKDKIYATVSLILLLGACSRPLPEGYGERPATQTIEASIGISLSDETRTSIGDDGMTTRWSVGDKIALWARNAAGEYCVEAASFSLRHFSANYSTALFTGRITAMEQGDYDYFMAYPVPSAVEGTKASYDIPAVQSGKYDGQCDVMISSATRGEALSADLTANVSAVMHHMMHAVKITIPEGRNLFGQRFTRLEMTFPYPVTGRVTYDVTRPDEAPTVSEQSNTLVIENAEGFDAGDTLWAFVLPSAAPVEGEIGYMVSNERSYSESVAYDVRLDTQPGHVTPIKMTVPTRFKYTAIEFRVGENHLGENYDTLTVYDASGTLVATFPYDASGVYTKEYFGDFDHPEWNGTDFTLSFDSEHAIVSTKVNVGTIEPYSYHRFDTAVPYLLEENFDLITDSDGNPYSVESDSEYSGASVAGNKSAISFLNGWTGARIGLSSGNAIRIACRREMSTSYPARVDSAPMSGLKPGTAVDITVTFDYGMDRRDGGIGTADVGQYVYLGYVTSNTAYKSGDGTGEFVADFYIKEKGASYTNIPHKDYSFTIQACTPSTRITWRTVREHKTGANNNTFWLYIDNVRVQIKQ